MTQHSHIVATALWGAASLTALSLALGGCAAQANNATATKGASNCQANADCPTGQICRAGLCSSREVSPATLDFRFIPPGSSGFLPQFRDSVNVRADQSSDFLLRRGVSVSSGQGSSGGDQRGGIRIANSVSGGPTGTLIFRPNDTQDSLFFQEAHVDHGEFSAIVNPGTYSLTFVPDDRTVRPKKTWANQEFTSNTVLLRTLPAPGDYMEVSGTLTRDVVLADGTPATARAVADARVYALSTDGAHSSTVVTTDDSGSFRLWVEPATDTYNLFVVPATAYAMVPHAEVDGAFSARADKCVTKAGVESDACSLTVSLGAYPDQPVPVSVQLTAPPAYDGQASWEGTTVIVRGPLGRGEFVHKFDANADGSVDLSVFPAEGALDHLRQYTLEVVPPPRSPFARTQIDFTGAIDPTSARAVPVELKHRLDGQVLDSQGNPMASANLDFYRDGQSAGDVSSHDTRAVSVTTDESGSFEVWLQKAPYQVEIAPSTTSGQPRMLAHVDASQIETGGSLRFDLPRPTVLVGSVLGAKDASGQNLTGVSEVTVEAYRVVDGRTVVLGQSRTDAQGDFRMVLASDL